VESEAPAAVTGTRGERTEAWLHRWAAPFAELVTGTHRRPLRGAPKVEANARLTAATGVLILVLLAGEAVTVLSIRRLLELHYLIGLALIPPVLLKLAAVGRRFAGYYLHDPEYREAGPPPILLRLAGPAVVILTIAVLATGVELWLFGERLGAWWLTAHKGAFVLWLGAIAVHVLGHLERAPRLVVREVAGPRVAGAGARRAWLAAALLMGVTLAAASLAYASPFVIPLEH
jgi:hypothetical protein